MSSLPADDNLWRELWDYDPNALLVVDGEMRILVVNPAFCRMFSLNPDTAVGLPAERIIGDVSPLREALAERRPIPGRTRRIANYGLVVREVGFALPERNLVAVIYHDVTTLMKQAEELEHIREQAAQRVSEVVAKQMTVVQEVAGLLGESMAQTRVSLYELLRTVTET